MSAWKQYGPSRWALRVNPSSGNLHPTEGYLVTGLPAVVGAQEAIGVFHYAPREHALEQRCRVDAGQGTGTVDWATTFLIGLSSIHWREAWKYGERAFRYCQHDAGHAIAAVRFAGALFGWSCTLLPRWSDADVAALCGLPGRARPEDPEPEAPDCLLAIGTGNLDRVFGADPALLVDAVARGAWTGTPNRLSPSRVDWPAIEDVAKATVFPGVAASATARGASLYGSPRKPQGFAPHDDRTARGASLYGSPRERVAFASEKRARDLILRRRSALGFDGQSTLAKADFATMLQRLLPEGPPWDALWWEPHVHLVLFVHRVDDLPPGIYAFVRDSRARAPLAGAMRSEFLWEPCSDIEGLFLLAPLDCRDIARRLSCDQDIAADGFFGVAMLAALDAGVREYGPSFYRHLYWECGVIGQVLYLEAEAAGARATGIGCYYDDPTHVLLGLSGHAWQSLYHFSAGVPVEDTRLTSEPGYDWEIEQLGN